MRVLFAAASPGDLAGGSYDAQLAQLRESDQHRAADLPRAASRESFVASRLVRDRLLQQRCDWDGTPLLRLKDERRLFRTRGGAWGVVSLAHTDGMVAVAAAEGIAVGIDVEAATRPCRFRALSQRYFSSREATRIRELDDQSGHRAFIELWTLKEAYGKATGEGVAMVAAHAEFEWRPANVTNTAGGVYGAVAVPKHAAPKHAAPKHAVPKHASHVVTTQRHLRFLRNDVPLTQWSFTQQQHDGFVVAVAAAAHGVHFECVEVWAPHPF